VDAEEKRPRPIEDIEAALEAVRRQIKRGLLPNLMSLHLLTIEAALQELLAIRRRGAKAP
jgi:hypothetical protein